MKKQVLNHINANTNNVSSGFKPKNTKCTQITFSGAQIKYLQHNHSLTHPKSAW